MGGKRHNRQPDAHINEVSDDSSESGDKMNSGDRCPHACQILSKTKLNFKKYFKKSTLDSECKACKNLPCGEATTDEEEFAPSSLWICLRCAHQGCGREQKSHALEHSKSMMENNHCVAANTQKWNIWCYYCDIEVTGNSRNQLLRIVESLKLLDNSRSMKKKDYLLSPVSHQPIPLPFAQANDNENFDKSNLSLNGLTRVVGLTNLGNTCFFNAVLQCLSQTPFLVKVLEDLQEPGASFVLPGGKCKIPDDSEETDLPPIEGILGGWEEFTPILCKTLKTMQSMKSRQIFTPNELLASFKKKNMQCMDGGQHDSHEILRHLLELVRNEDLRRYQAVILKHIGIPVPVKPNSVNDMHKAHLKFYGRQAGARLLGPEVVFRGVLVSTLECLECHHSSQRTEPFLDLSLPVMADKPQPPVLKRKNKTFEDPFDSMINNISTIPTTNNEIDTTAKCAATKSHRHSRRQVIASGRCDSTSNTNRIFEEQHLGNFTLEIERDTDVEDNVSASEIAESDYSSEKASAVTSSVSSSDHDLSKDPISQCELNGTSINGNLPLTPAATSTGLAEWTEVMALKPPKSSSVNSELSNEGATISSVSSPVTSKDSPTSPISSAIDEEPGVKKKSNSCLDNDTEVTDELRLINMNSSRNLMLADEETPESQMVENQVDQPIENQENQSADNKNEQSTTSILAKPEVTPENGIADIIVGLSKVAVTPSSQRNRYHTTDGDCSIQSCLNQFTALEFMSGSNKVGCEACTARENKSQGKEGSTKMVCTPSTKQYLVSKVPAVLILHLKRFQSFQSLRTGFRKLTKHVAFPLLLDLAPVSKGVGKPKIYSLYGVVEHSGNLHGGHYVAYVKTRPPLAPDDPRWAFLPSKDSNQSAENSSPSSSDSEGDHAEANCNVQPPPGNWYHVSDSRLVEVDEATVLRAQAYILFYERIL